ncbi:4Fe-4S dicluster domain-containing protein [Prolixibacteraceae bacterium JC049]|nr:4Fe-4S dicluster domain-containing protein [Prolixibacteraceae bacterium JC049]
MKKYWRSIEELTDSTKVKKEELSYERANKKAMITGKSLDQFASTRRDFLKVFGYSIAGAAVVASCKKPVEKAIPYLVRPEEVTPGKASYYASTYFEENEYCSVLVKVRDGRPIKIEGNELSSITRQGTSARVQASVLSLYDTSRYKTPLFNGKATTWEKVDKVVPEKLDAVKASGGELALLTPTIISPTTRSVIDQFLAKYSNIKWIQYDAVSASGMLDANEANFGKRALPAYHLDKAKVIVSVEADFLGTWLNPTAFTKQYSSRRDPDLKDGMSRHYQIESMMTLTGSNADERFVIRPSEKGVVLLNLYNAIAKVHNAPTFQVTKSSFSVQNIANDLLANQGKSLVMCGSNDPADQVIVNAINFLLGNYGHTVDMNQTMNTKQGSDQEVAKLVAEINAQKIAGIIAVDVNPVYDFPEGDKLKKAISKLDLSIALAQAKNETAAVCELVLPLPHYLEDWNDSEPITGQFSLAQPAINSLFEGRSLGVCLNNWQGVKESYRDVVKKYWEKNIFPLQNKQKKFESFWIESLRNGVFDLESKSPKQPTFNIDSINQYARSIKKAKTEKFEVVLYEMTGKGNGASANNPWIMEMPDPVSKVSWDNFAAVSPKLAVQLGVKNEDLIDVNGMKLPVFIQPGQQENTISVALGFGRNYSGKVANGAGKNCYQLIQNKDGHRIYNLTANVKKVDGTYPLAMTQTHHNMEGREIVREAVLEEYKKKADAGNEAHAKHESHHVTLYDKPDFPAHHWAMAIDLNKCTGCGNCTIACQSENNVAVIGKEQVRNRRIMHWLRIDRYYSENPENPKTYHQPVMCQHCDNAPCENVCPVSATVHSNEGINQMAYNRCVGTRYCVNNCPYKVRRFNWFKYANNDKFDFNMNNDLGKMVLNPDVTIRSRGVVEKCSFCVQRIQEKKLDAKLDNRKVKDGEIQTACMQSCPADAIVFGDLNDKNSKISKLFEHPRNYHLLEELHTLPSVGYLTKIRNSKKA